MARVSRGVCVKGIIMLADVYVLLSFNSFINLNIIQ